MSAESCSRTSFHILVGKAQGNVPFEGIEIVIRVELLSLHSLDCVRAAVVVVWAVAFGVRGPCALHRNLLRPRDAEEMRLKMMVNCPVTRVEDSAVLCFVQTGVDCDLSTWWLCI